MDRLLMAFFVFFSVTATAETVITTVCSKEDPRYKVSSTLEVHKAIDSQSGKDVTSLVSILEVDGRKIASLQKVCAPKRCAHRDGENVVEVYPHFDAQNVAKKVDLLLWYGAGVNRVTLTDCKSK